MTTPRDPQARAALARMAPVWRRDPVRFSSDVLGVTPWDGPGASQSKWMRLVPTTRRLAVRSGHKTGKSLGAACIALWAFSLFDHVRVVLTAPTGRQIEEVVWREVTRLYRDAAKRGFFLGGKCYETWSKGIKGPMGRQVFGISTDTPDAFSGVSGPFVLYIVDEGSGIEDKLWEAIFGNSAANAFVVTLGNPTRTDGQFFRAFHEESDVWTTYHLSSEDTPNVRGEAAVPGLAEPEWVALQRRIYAPHDSHPVYAVRVRGNFPLQGSDSVVSLANVEAAVARWTNGSDAQVEHLPLVGGLDVARYGDDDSALVLRRGHRIVLVERTGGMGTLELAGWVRKHVVACMTPRERNRWPGVPKPTVNVDVIGVGGGVYDVLRDTAKRDFDVVEVNVASASDEDEKYTNLRSQLMFAVDAWLKDGGCIPGNLRLRSDLLAPRYSFDVRGRQKVEPKPEIKKRLGRSPDIGDALALAVYANASAVMRGVHVPGL